MEAQHNSDAGDGEDCKSWSDQANFAYVVHYGCGRDHGWWTSKVLCRFDHVEPKHDGRHLVFPRTQEIYYYMKGIISF